MIDQSLLYGLLAEYDDPDKLVAAARQARAADYHKLDGFSPFPVEGLAEAVGYGYTLMPLIVLLGGILGAVLGFFMQYFAYVHDYPLNVGGRPLNSWPAFFPVSFELCILTASIFGLLGLFALNGFPMPYHPVFNEPRFNLASRDRFFLLIQAEDPQFDVEKTKKFLKETGAEFVTELQK